MCWVLAGCISTRPSGVATTTHLPPLEIGKAYDIGTSSSVVANAVLLAVKTDWIKVEASPLKGPPGSPRQPKRVMWLPKSEVRYIGFTEDGPGK